LDETFSAGLGKLRETLRLLNNDNEQEWIEKYRAALVQPPPSRRSRLVAALNTLARTLGSAIGKTSGKRADAAQGAAVSNSPISGVQEHPRGHSKEKSVSKKSSPPGHHQDKKAS
jgi:hypothetical protein